MISFDQASIEKYFLLFRALTSTQRHERVCVAPVYLFERGLHLTIFTGHSTILLFQKTTYCPA